LATVHARDNRPTTNDVTTQPVSIVVVVEIFMLPISASFTKVK